MHFVHSFWDIYFGIKIYGATTTKNMGRLLTTQKRANQNIPPSMSGVEWREADKEHFKVFMNIRL